MTNSININDNDNKNNSNSSGKLKFIGVSRGTKYHIDNYKDDINSINEEKDKRNNDNVYIDKDDDNKNENDNKMRKRHFIDVSRSNVSNRNIMK